MLPERFYGFVRIISRDDKVGNLTRLSTKEVAKTAVRTILARRLDIWEVRNID